MTTPDAMDPWANTDHDPLSHTEPTTAPTMNETHRAHAISGAVLAHYPDFPPGAPVRVLPPIVSHALPTDRRAVDDSWTFAGPTRHPEYASIRHDHDHVSVAIERHRLQPRPAK
ncbi:hypothetical protein BN1232_06141 [Mycobacterium lentiflavum]|uniref:Uncharacterized protein n=1 Tax=Mycobacterium lentiflavum TaxID=141349 RepID=A0A0E4H2R3_MYCLN|nr:hypothetical protein [Mycobacterium lentiflavum]CQD24283.1 hypothetical protein BN1232_06141 [Mycobacterium lentiflavum]